MHCPDCGQGVEADDLITESSGKFRELWMHGCPHCGAVLGVDVERP